MIFETNLWNNWLIPKLYISDTPEASLSVEDILDKDKTKINMQLRDVKMLATLLGAKFMTTNQLSACFWSGHDAERACRRRLRTLWNYGLLARIRPRAKSKTGSLPWIWAITKKAIQILDRSGLPLYEERLKKETSYDETSTTLPSQILLRHSILVSEFGTRCLASGGDWYFDHETATALDVPILNTKTKLYYPDAILEWGSDEKKITWLLELERSAQQRRFREKMSIWRSLRLLAKTEGTLDNQFVVIVGRVKDTLPDRDERSILPLARILVKDGGLLDFVKFIGIPDELHTAFDAKPLDPQAFLNKHGG